MATTTPNFGWSVPTSTDLVKDGATAIETLGDSVDASMADLLGGTSGQILAKNSNTNMDFIWINNDQGDITEVQAGTGISVASGTGPVPIITNTVATAFDAAGDLVYGTGADTFTKLALGTAGKVLTVNSGATAPEWATPAAGGKVLQVVAMTNATEQTSSSTAYAATNLTATITPATSGSRILVMVYTPIGKSSGNSANGLLLRLRNDTSSTTLLQSNVLLYDGAAQTLFGSYAGSVVHSPASTAAQTYTLQFANYNASANVAVQQNDGTGSMILIEIGA